MAIFFQDPSDGLCATLDGNRQDIVELLGNALDGERAEIVLAAAYPAAADSMRCAATITVRDGAEGANDTKAP